MLAAPQINQLPDLCLISILKPLSIRELTRLRLICHRWNYIIPSVLCQKTQLRILCKPTSTYNSSVHFLRCDRLDFFGIHNIAEFDYELTFEGAGFLERNAFLRDQFPNVKQLTVVSFGELTPENVKSLLELLGNWRGLTQLKLVGLRNGNYSWTAFAHLLNGMRQLTRLSIDVNVTRLKDLGIYPQLGELYCRYVLADRVELNLYQRSLPCQLIGGQIARYGLYVEDNGAINCLAAREAAKLERLAIKVGFLSQLKLISAKFTSLRYLDLTFYDNESPLKAFLTCLQQLRHLVELKLFLSPLHNYFMKLSHKNLANLPKLTSLKQVELQFPVDPHKFGRLEAIFPNADRIQLVIAEFLFLDYQKMLCNKQQCEDCRWIGKEIERCQEAKENPELHQPQGAIKIRLKKGKIIVE